MTANKLAVMEEYESLVCKKCGKVDEKAAFAHGIQDEVVVRSKRPFLHSMDDYNLLDERAKLIFTALFPDEIDYYRIPSAAFYVASARSIMQPDETNPGFRFASPRRCPTCGRPKEVVWGQERLVIPNRMRFFAVNVEGILGTREVWHVSSDAAADLRKVSPPLTGMVLSPQEVVIGGLS